jgi:hypothetical protein
MKEFSITAMISYNVVVGDTLSKVLVRFIPSLGTSMGSVRFFIVFLVTLVSVYRSINQAFYISENFYVMENFKQ